MENEEQRRARRAKDQQSYGCIVVLVLLICAALTFWLAFGPNGFLLDRPSAVSEPIDEGSGDLGAKVGPGPITVPEQLALRATINDRFPRGVKIASEQTFYFAGLPAGCGRLKPTSGKDQRYVYRDNYVATEDSMPAGDFAQIWQICEAASPG